MSLEHPLFLWLLALAIPYAGISLRIILKIRACAANYSLTEKSRWSAFASRRVYAFILGAMFYCLTVLGLANPSMGTRYVTEQVRDVETVFVLDVSNSMASVDGTQSRLLAATSFIRAVVAATPGTRNALYAFKGSCVLLVPPTSSALAFEDALSWASPLALTSSGSNVAQALLSANRKGGSGLARVLVLLTDGNDTGSQAADACKAVVKSGVRLCIVGFGAKIPVAVLSADGHEILDLQGNPVALASNEAEIRKWAASSGAVYAGIGSPASLSFVIDYVMKNSVLLGRARNTAVPASLQYLFISAAAACFMASVFLSRPFFASARPGKRGGKLAGLFMLAFSVSIFTSCPRLASDFEVLKANSVYKEGRYNEAIALYLGVKETDDTQTLSYNVANAFVALGEFDSALPAYEKITASDKVSLASAAWYNMGLSWYALEAYENALRAFKESLLLVPSDADACRAYELALSALRQKEVQSVKERARAMDGPGSEAAMFSLSRKAHTELFVPGVSGEKRSVNDH